MRFIYWFGAVIIMLIAISFIDDWVKAIKRFLKSIEFKVFDMSEDDLMIFNQLMEGRN